MSEKNKMDQRTFDRIEDYLDDRLDSEEMLAFEVKVKKDPELARELEIQTQLRHSIEVGAMKEELDTIHEKFFNEVDTSSSRMSKWKIAAGIALVLGIGALLFNNGSREEVLFAEYVTTDPGLPVTMSSNDQYAFSDGMVSYKEGHYQEALTTWETITSNEIASDKLTYYKACAHFNMEDYTSALGYLEDLINNPQSDFHDKAVWYACLSYLQLKQDQEILSLSTRKDSPYWDRIESIKQELSE